MVARLLLLFLVPGCYVAVRGGRESWSGSDRGNIGEIGFGLELPLARVHANDDRFRPTGPWAGVSLEAPSVMMQPAAGNEHGGIGAHLEGIGALEISSAFYVRAQVGLAAAGGVSNTEYATGGIEGQVLWQTGWSIVVGAGYARGVTSYHGVDESWQAPLGTVKLFYTPLIVSFFEKLSAVR